MSENDKMVAQRRGFLKTLGLAAGGAAAATAAEASAPLRADAVPAGTARKEGQADRLKARYQATGEAQHTTASISLPASPAQLLSCCCSALAHATAPVNITLSAVSVPCPSQVRLPRIDYAGSPQETLPSTLARVCGCWTLDATATHPQL